MFFIEIGHVGYLKIRLFVLIRLSPMAFSLKIQLKIVKLKTGFFQFYSDWVHFLTKPCLSCQNQRQNMNLLIPNTTYLCQKKFEVLLSTLKNFGGPAGHEGAL